MDSLILFNILENMENQINTMLSNRRKYERQDVRSIVKEAKYRTAKQLLSEVKNHD